MTDIVWTMTTMLYRLNKSFSRFSTIPLTLKTLIILFLSIVLSRSVGSHLNLNNNYILCCGEDDKHTYTPIIITSNWQDDKCFVYLNGARRMYIMHVWVCNRERERCAAWVEYVCISVSACALYFPLHYLPGKLVTVRRMERRWAEDREGMRMN